MAGAETVRRPFDLPVPGAIAFTPEADGFNVAFSEAVLDPGFGSALELYDDDTEEVDFPAGFPFLGTIYPSLFVNSDGNVTMGTGDGTSTRRDAGRLVGGPPRVAPLLVDLDPSRAGGVFVDVRSDRLVVTWSGVSEYSRPNSNTFQAVLHHDGSIDLVYAAVDAEVGLVGVAEGGAVRPVHRLDLTADLPVTREAGAIFEDFVIVEWTSYGPPGGYFRELAINPVDPSTLYVANDGELFESVDAGESWNRVGLSSLTSGDIFAIEIDPVTTSTLYALTRDGVFKSTDQGEYWTRRSHGLPPMASLSCPFGHCSLAMAIDPVDPSTVYAGIGHHGAFKSIDGGDSWNPVGDGLILEEGILALAIDPASPSTLYAGTDHFGMFKSTDSGMSWSHIDLGFDETVCALAIDPVDPSTLYAGGCGWVSQAGILKSTDGGEHWTAVGGPERAGDLAIDPVNPSILYALSSGVFKSMDGGESWTVLEFANFNPLTVGIDPRNPSTVYVATGGGLPGGMFKSTDGGESWKVVTHGLHATFVRSLAVDPRHSSNVYAGTYSSGMFKSLDFGNSWLPVNEGLSQQMAHQALVIDPSDPTTVYSGMRYHGVFKSTDSGQTWRGINEGLSDPNVRTLAIDPQTPSTVYAGTVGAGSRRGVFKSLDGGETWAHLFSWLVEFVAVLAVDPQNPSTLYAGSEYGGVFKSMDGGLTWSATLGLSDTVRALVIDPLNPSVLFAGGEVDGLFKSVDGGERWTRLRDRLPYRKISALTIDQSALYAAAYGAGVLKSIDGGESWTALNYGLPAFVDTLAIDPVNFARLYAGTYGSGVFQLTQACAPDATTLCLNDRRFTVEVDWQDFDGQDGPGRVVPVGSDDSGLFWFFSEDNWEMLVKVLDGCSINDRFWVFSAATTNVEYTLRVTDTESGAVREYVNPLGTSAAAVTDTAAFATCSGDVGGVARAHDRVELTAVPPTVLVQEFGPSASLKGTPCVSGSSDLCLNQDRFRVEVDWLDFQGGTGSGQVVPFGSDDSGLFWFFHPDNWEMLVKVLDGCGLNDRYWVFGAATTNVEYTLRVTDIETGRVREFLNPLGNAAAAITDTAAFATCP